MTVRRSLVTAAVLLAAASGAFSAQHNAAGPEPAATYQWRALPGLPRAISGQMVGTSHGALVVAGGTNFPTPLFDGGTKVWYGDVYVLEQDASSWRTEAALARPLAYAGVASVDDRIIVAGGSDAARHYADAFSLEWIGGSIRRSPLPPLPAPAANVGAAAVGRTFYLVGGSRAPDSTEASSEVWALDLQSPDSGWRRLPPVPGGGRILPVVVAQAGQVIVASGASLSAASDGRPVRRYLTDAYAWTPAPSMSTNAGPSSAPAGSWRRLADIPRAVVAAPAAALGSTQVAVFGGDDGSLADRTAELRDAHPGFSRDVLAYDTTTDTWTSLGMLPTAPVTTPAVRLGDAVVIAGGELRPGFRTAAVSIGRTDAPEQIDVFTAGEGGYHTYRIPSVIATAKGTLLAFAEGRRASAGDAGDIDLVLKRSTDGGRTWSQASIVGDNGPNTFGNPCPVVDRTTGTIWLLSTHNAGTDREAAIIAGESTGTRTVWLMKSDDDGVSWSEAVEITAAVKRSSWTWYATGPGVGIQTRSGRLVIPANHAEGGTEVHRSHIVYSDDHGATWQIGATSDPGTNESQVAELSDGRLMLNMRNHPRKPENFRLVALSADEGQTLSPARPDVHLLEPPAQASLLSVSGPDGRSAMLLFSNPAAATRVRMTVRTSADDGRTWSRGRVLHDGPSAYSSLVALADDMVGVLYERGDTTPYERLTFARMSSSWLADGQ